MLDQLLATDGVTEISRLDGAVGFMALHGGLETATYAIADRASADSGASLYTVRQPWSMYWHVPSVQFDPKHSTALTDFLNHVDLVFSVHGFGRPGMESSVLCGGGNRPLAGRVADALRRAGFDAIDDIDRIPERLRGLSGRNPVNLSAAGGVQVEVGHGLRKDPDTPKAIAGVLAKAAANEMRSICARPEC